ncbi:MAG: ATP-dependent DNA helicase RecG [Candidatus Kapaibacterium sp.]|nr:ATP-dependent DNA helicase RecG [Ignavibacteriota bacterium]MCB9220412.1 ATP-dependent DNA helicase RecG [Ignavibacteria bacterium]
MNKPISNDLPLQFIKGIGPKRAQVLAKENICQPLDLINYFPRDYINRDSSFTLSSLSKKLFFNTDNIFDYEEDFKNVEYSFIVDVVDKSLKNLRNRRKLLTLTVKDNSGGKAKINFWANVHFFDNSYKVGDKLLISGKPDKSKFGISFTHPEIDKIDSDELKEFKEEGILPLYKLPTSFIKVGIRNRALRDMIRYCLNQHLTSVNETLDKDILVHIDAPDIQTAIENLHFPMNAKLLQLSQKRFKFEEMLFYQLAILSQQDKFVKSEKAIAMGKSITLAKATLKSFPFELTNDQKNALNLIWKKLNSTIPMNVLLQGDVGSGKTIVAIVSMMMAVESGHQTLLMAPTEILAKQHYKTLQSLLPDSISTELLVGGLSAKDKKEILGKIESGLTNIIIGTHALFQDKVEYNNLGYVVIDEQHRFGVDQRSLLKELGKKSGDNTTVPHMLLMTATPIPRTLAMTKYTDLQIVSINSKPTDRKDIITKVRFESDLTNIYEFIKDQVKEGRQAYIVYPLVEESEKLELKSAVEHFELLNNQIFPELSCGLLHGQMHWKEKDEVMKDFSDKKYDVLISTTVIEVGIDVPNSTVMLIENAERFGLSQLHQLRGRVGRGEHQSYCILVASQKYKQLFAKNLSDIPTVKRLTALESISNGFELSEIDLELRGPGDFLGTKQSGMPEFKFIDIVNDKSIIREAKEIAERIIHCGMHNYPKTAQTYSIHEKKGNYITVG